MSKLRLFCCSYQGFEIRWMMPHKVQDVTYGWDRVLESRKLYPLSFWFHAHLQISHPQHARSGQALGDWCFPCGWNCPILCPRNRVRCWCACVFHRAQQLQEEIWHPHWWLPAGARFYSLTPTAEQLCPLPARQALRPWCWAAPEAHAETAEKVRLWGSSSTPWGGPRVENCGLPAPRSAGMKRL